MRVIMRGVNTVRKRLADGSIRLYYYHRATGMRLRGEPGSPEFMASFAEAEKKPLRDATGTLSGLISAFQNSAEWNKLADSTRREYTRMLVKAEAEYGSAPFEALEDREFRADVLEWRDKHAKQSPREADHRISAMARVLAWAADRGRLRVNVLSDVRRVYHADRSEQIWLPEHIETFNAVAPIELQQALMLALHTGQRQGDLIKLTWQAYDGQAITLRQGKTKVRVRVPCTVALRETLDEMKKAGRQAVILTTSTGRPWKGQNFQHRWKYYMNLAEIEGLHFHDLRGTAVTMLSEAGCTHQEVAAITGHSLRHVGQIIDRYLSRTRELAENAIVKMEAHMAKQGE